MNVRISDDAEHDLEDIADFIAHDDPLRAVTFVRELRSACFALGDFPKAYPLVRRYESSIRRRVHGAYLIFYHVDHHTVTVARILHSARDHDEILFPD